MKAKKPKRRTVTVDLPPAAWDKLVKITDTQFVPKAIFVRSVLLAHLSQIKQ
jgi:hypothetical protein